MFHTYIYSTELDNKNYLTIWISDMNTDNCLLDNDIKQYFTFSNKKEEELFKSKVIPEHVFIIYPDSLNLKNIKKFKSRLDYFKNTKIKFISYDVNGEFDKKKRILAELKEKAIIDLFNKNNAMMTIDKNYHFQTLSRKHTDKFIKISNLLVNKNEIDFLSICLLKFIDESNIYVDTSSILSLIQSTILLKKNISKEFKVPSIYNFHSYEQEKYYLENLEYNSQIIISTTTTATLVKTIKNHNVNLKKILVLFYFPIESPVTEDFEYMVRLTELLVNEKPPINKSQKDCHLCKEGSIPVQLHSEQFIISNKESEPIKLTVHHKSSYLVNFMKNYVGTNVLMFGGRDMDHKKFDFTIDINNLIINEEFNKKLKYMIEKYISLSIKRILFVDHISEEFSKLINNKLKDMGLDAISSIHSEEFLKDAEESKIEYDKNESVLILVGSISSGYALEEISRRLRETHPHSSRYYIIGINKQYSEESFSFMRGNIEKNHIYNQNHLVLDIDKILLPTKVIATTWDKELELLKLIYQPEDFSEIDNTDIYVRIKELESIKEKASNVNIFWKNTLNQNLKIASGFAFWPFFTDRFERKDEISEADVLYTFASVLQYARVSKEKLKAIGKEDLSMTLYHRKVLAPENFARFNDGILQASLLRLSNSNELDYSTNRECSKTISHMIKNIIVKHNTKQGEAAMEFLIAIATKHLKLHSDDFQLLFSEMNISVLPEYFQLIINHIKNS